MAYQVNCPHCRATLKSAKPVPAGLEVLCPKCKQLFKSPKAPVQEQVSAVPVGAAAGGAPAPAPTSVQAGEPPFTAPTGPVSEPLIDIARPQRGMSTAGRLTLVVGSIVVLLGLGVGLTIWCFSGPASSNDGKQQAKKNEAGKKKREPVVILTLEEQLLVDGMKAKGLDFLRKTQREDGAWAFPNPEHQADMAAMGGLTLLECGASSNDAAVQKAAAFVRKHVAAKNRIYGCGLFVLFLTKLDEAQDRKAIRTLALRIVAGQSAQGGWDYPHGGLPILTPAEEDEIEKALASAGTKRPWQALAKENPNWVRSLGPRASTLGLFHMPENAPPEHYRVGGDNSNTQFAVLALLAARRQGMPVDQSLLGVVKRFRASQHADGHWEYDNRTLGEASNVAMTSAGLLALAVGYDLDFPEAKPHPEPKKDPQIVKGLAYVGSKINRNKSNDEKIYTLWSVERAGMLFQMGQIGGKDWFRWGLRVLGSHQVPDGSWNFNLRRADGFAPSTDTCFALLFLQRINLTHDLTDKIELLSQALEAETAKKD